MKNYSITVNGKTYEVAVEEKGGSAAPKAAVHAPVAAAPAPAAKPATPAPAAPVAKPAAPSGGPGVKVVAPMPGKIIALKVAVGDSVKNGQEILVMEAMKMHNPVLAGSDGVIKELLVKAGDPVQAGTVLAVIG